MLGDCWIDPNGELLDTSDSFDSRAREFARLLQAGDIPFARFVSLSRSEARDVVTFDVSVELPQDRVHDIRPWERVSAEFSRNDGSPPEVFALRRDFPYVPHLNLRDTKIPRSLCLFDAPWPEIRLFMTPARFVSVIRNWLSNTARNELHADDQPLEPLLLASGGVMIVPPGLWDTSTDDCIDVVGIASQGVPFAVYQAFQSNKERFDNQENVRRCQAVNLRGEPTTHGVIERTPRTLGDLSDLLSVAGIDVVAELVPRLLAWREEQDLLQRELILTAILPRRRTDSSTTESWSYYAFLLHGNIKSLGVSLGVLAVRDQYVVPLIPRGQPNLGSVELTCLNVVRELSPIQAALMSGRDPDPRDFVAVGQGALGSQVVTNLARGGFGSWLLMDKDVLLPHNLARHALFGHFTGIPKAVGMGAAIANTVIDANVRALVCDVLNLRSSAASFQQELERAKVIFDFSASLAVERHLATDIASEARRVSVFLSPDGKCLVMLAEDSQRRVKLHELEAPFFRLLLQQVPALDFYENRAGTVRYGHGCSDTSMRIPPERVALHAALAAGAIRGLTDDASVTVWQLTDELSVLCHRKTGTVCKWYESAGWSVGIDASLIETLQCLRERNLPSETGGVLVGTLDAQRNRVLVVDVIQGPSDSWQAPNGFIRGSSSLTERLQAIEQRTAQGVQYVGEWHSHPSGASLAMSCDDRKLLQFLSERVEADGLPGIVLIVGEGGERFHIENRGGNGGASNCAISV